MTEIKYYYARDEKGRPIVTIGIAKTDEGHFVRAISKCSKHDLKANPFVGIPFSKKEGRRWVERRITGLLTEVSLWRKFMRLFTGKEEDGKTTFIPIKNKRLQIELEELNLLYTNEQGVPVVDKSYSKPELTEFEKKMFRIDQDFNKGVEVIAQEAKG